MSTPLSLDLCVRVLAAVASGLSHREAGERFGVSAASVSRWRALEREQGSARAKQMGGDQRSQHIEGHRDLILSLHEATADISLHRRDLDLHQHGTASRARTEGAAPADERAARACVDAPFGARRISRQALRVIGCCHVFGLSCGTIMAAGPDGSSSSGIRSTSLERARSTPRAPGSPDPASPTLRHTCPLTSSPRRQPHTRRWLMQQRLELDRSLLWRSAPRPRERSCWPEPRSPASAAYAQAYERARIRLVRLCAWPSAPHHWLR